MRSSDFDKIISSEQLILIDFYASWSGVCRAMEQTLDRVALAMGDMVTIKRVNISSIANTRLTKRYNIVTVPTLMLFYRGEPIWRYSGALAFERLCNIIRRHQTVEGY